MKRLAQLSPKSRRTNLAHLALAFLVTLANVLGGDAHTDDDIFWQDAAALLPAYTGAPTEPGPSSENGQWSSVVSWPHVPVSLALLPNGKLLTYSGQEVRHWPGTAHQTRWTIYDPSTGTFDTDTYLGHEMFCAGTVMRSDGTLQTTGGRFTIEHSSRFDFRTGEWTRATDMFGDRWYNTSVAKPNGDVLAFSGKGSPNEVEEYDHETDSWRIVSGLNWTPIGSLQQNWAHVMLAPDGRLFHFGPRGTMHWVDAEGNGSLQSNALSVPSNVNPSEAPFAMYDIGKVIVLGGYENGISSTSAYTVDFNQQTPVLNVLPSGMTEVRQFSNAVVLPTGEVLVIGGNSQGRKFTDIGGLNSVEIWNPQTEQFRAVASMSVLRGYHSTAVLLPDGRVFAGGSGYGGNGTESWNHDDAEFYTPPSLFDSNGNLKPRPSITAAPESVSTGSVFNVAASPGLATFAALRLTSTTHAMNTDQRRVSLPFSEVTPGNYQVLTHPSPNVMVPGYWMLFGVQADGAYSEAKIFHVKEIGSTPDAGLTAEYFDGMTLTNSKFTRVDHVVEFDWNNGSPDTALVGNDTFSVRWTGTVVPDYTETYTFHTTTDDGVRLWINGTQIIDQWIDQAPTEHSGSIALQAGVPVSITMEYYENTGGATAELRWSSPRTPYGIVPETNLRQSAGTGELTVASDDTVEVFIDGQLVAIGSDWKKAVTANFSGATTIAMRACDQGGTAGLIGEFLIGSQTIDTSTSWLVSTTEQAGWEQPGFDDSTWTGATDYGAYGDAPWGTDVEGFPANSNARWIWAANANANDVFFRINIGAPQLGGIADRNGVVGDVINFDVPFSASPFSTLTFSATGLPSGLSINASTGKVTGTLQSEGVFDPVTITVVDQLSNSDSETFNWTVRLPGQGSGTILREWWLGISGTTVASLTTDSRYPYEPDATAQPTQFEAPTNFSDNYGQRLRGYVHAPVTGDYRFWIASDNASSLLLSTDGAPGNATQIASVATFVGSRQWLTFPSQESALVSLVGGQAYYIEALHKDGAGGDNLSVAWQAPGDTDPMLIDGAYLSPFQPPTLSPIANRANTVGDVVTFNVIANDPDDTDLLYSETDLPAGLTLNASSGVISGSVTTANAYAVTITVDDQNGGLDQETFTWTVSPPAGVDPIIPSVASVGGNVSYMPTVTGGTGLDFSWNFNDGTADTPWSASPNITHTFTAPGKYRVTLSIRDSNGTITTTDLVQNIAPVLDPNRPVNSQTVAFEDGANRVWNVNPDNDTVTVINATTGAKITEIAVGNKPRGIAIDPDGSNAWVTLKDQAAITTISTSTLQVTGSILLDRGSAPHGIVFDPAGTHAYVALQDTGEILKINANTQNIVATLDAGPTPRHLAITHDGTKLYASRFITKLLAGEETATINMTSETAEVLAIATSSMTITKTIALAHSTEADFGGGARGIPNYLGGAAVSPAGDMAWVPSKQDNIQRGLLRDGSQLTHESTTRSITSKINLATETEEHISRMDHDDASMPSSAIFGPHGVHLFIALEGSREVAVVDVYGEDELLRFDTGRTPQGLTLSDDGLTLYVHNFLSRTVTSHDISQLVENGIDSVTRNWTRGAVASETLAADVLLGKRHFYDARDNRIGLQDYMSCAMCHNEGGHDGRTWDFTGFGEGLRNSIDLRIRGGVDHGPLHWSANFDEVQDFEGQIRTLGGGTGLIAGGSPHPPLGTANAGRSADLDALAAYLGSLTKEVDSPHRTAAGNLTTAGQAGRALFVTNNCAQCHSGTGFTDSPSGIRHDIGTIKSTSGGRLGGTLDGLDTPTLRGLWSTAPYLHDGSSPTLQDAIAAHGLGISASDRNSLAAYLQQIDSNETSAPGDTTRPTVVLSTPSNSVTAPFAVSVAFSESVTGFTSGDLVVTNGTLSNFTTSGFDIAPTAEGAVTVRLPANRAFDGAGNGNFASNLLSVTYTDPGTGGEDEITPDATTIALYHFNGDYDDASANSHDLLAAGGVSRANDNLSWMASPTGEAARFSAIGDVLAVAIPHADIFPIGGERVTVEFRYFPRNYLGYSIGNVPVVALEQNWDSHFALKDNKWGSNPRGPSFRANNAEILNASAWAAAVSPGIWHLVQWVYDDAAGTIEVLVDGSSIATASSSRNPFRTNDWILTLADFDGDIDELIIHNNSELLSGTGGGTPDITPPTVVLSTPSTNVDGAFDVTAQFDESVTGLAPGDLSTTNGTVSNLSGIGANYSFRVTPLVDGAVTVALGAGAVQDAAGNPSHASNLLSVTYTAPTGGIIGQEFDVTSETVALYHLNGDLADASPNGFTLSSSGVSFAADNLGWMDTPAGQVARFGGAGDTLTVSIPDSELLTSLGTPITLEAWIYPRAYSGYGVDNLPIVSLRQNWDTALELKDNKWAPERTPSVRAGVVEVMSASAWATNVADDVWHLLQIQFDGTSSVRCVIDGNIVSQMAYVPNPTRTNDWLLTLGNFSGDIDEVRVRRSDTLSMTANGGAALQALTSGVLAEYYAGTAFDELRFTTVEPSINHDWGSGAPDPRMPADQFSVRWKGCLTPEFSETYAFHLNANDSASLWINDVPVPNGGTLPLTAGQAVMIRVDYVEQSGDASVSLEWSSPSQGIEIISEANLSINEDGQITTGVSAYASTFGEWLSSPWRGGASGGDPLANDDGDFYNDLMEYALGETPAVGVPGDGGLRIAPLGDTYEAIFSKPAVVGDVTYTLEASDDNASWQDLPASDALTISFHPDGTETQRYDLSGVMTGDRLFVRLRLALDGSDVVAHTPVCVCYEVTFAEGYQTLGISAVKEAIFAGNVASVTGATLTLADVHVPALLAEGGDFYIEIRDGAHAGHRFEIDEATSSGSILSTVAGAALNTQGALPADLAGARMVIRPHTTVGEIFHKPNFAGGTDPSKVDQVLFYDGSGYSGLFLLEAAGLNYWTSTGDSSLTNLDQTPIAPGTGVFLHRADGHGPTKTFVTGCVRGNAFVQTLRKGYNLISLPWPTEMSPESRGLGIDNGFLGDVDPSNADQIQLWRGDNENGAAGYEGYFLLDAGEGSDFRYWTELSNSDLSNMDTSPLFKGGRAAFIRLEEEDHPGWVIEAP